MPWRSLRAASKALVARRVDLTVEGLEHVPGTGAAIIAARHYHHLYDGAVLLATIPRPVQVLVASDWAAAGPRRRALEAACRAAGWPVVVRAGRSDPERPASGGVAPGQMLGAIRRSVRLLASGGLLVVFPEGYPNVDPGYTPKADVAAFLPFEPGFARIARLAEHATRRPAPIVPAGLSYQTGDRWRIALRFGAPLTLGDYPDWPALVLAVEQAVRALSGHPMDT